MQEALLINLRDMIEKLLSNIGFDVEKDFALLAMAGVSKSQKNNLYYDCWGDYMAAATHDEDSFRSYSFPLNQTNLTPDTGQVNPMLALLMATAIFIVIIAFLLSTYLYAKFFRLVYADYLL
jgi:hypothetical protein